MAKRGEATSPEEKAKFQVCTWKLPNYLLVGAVGVLVALSVGYGRSTSGPYERAVALLNDYPLIDGYDTNMHTLNVLIMFCYQVALYTVACRIVWCMQQ